MDDPWEGVCSFPCDGCADDGGVCRQPEGHGGAVDKPAPGQECIPGIEAHICGACADSPELAKLKEIAERHADAVESDGAFTADVVLGALRELEGEHDRLRARLDEATELLGRAVKYAKEDRAVTPGSTRLARLLLKVSRWLPVPAASEPPSHNDLVTAHVERQAQKPAEPKGLGPDDFGVNTKVPVLR